MPQTTSASNRSSAANTHVAVDYQQLFDALPDSYIAVLPNDPAFTIVAENKSHAIVGLAKKRSTIGKPILNAFPDTSEKYRTTGVSDLIESFRKVIATDKPDAMPILRYDLQDSNGTFVTRYWSVTHYPLYSGTGATKKLAAIFQSTHDITDTVNVSDELTVARRQLDDVLSAGRVGTWLWDIKSNIVKGDKYMAEMFGVSNAAAAKGLPIDVFIKSMYDADRTRVQSEIEAALISGNTFESEYRTISRDGSVSWVIARGRIERDNSGEPLSFPGVLVDITERKRAENNLEYLAKASALLSATLDYHKTLQAISDLMVPTIADWCTIDMISDTNILELVAVAHKDPAKVKWARKLRNAQGPPDLKGDSGAARAIRTGEVEYYPLISDEMLVASAKSKAELRLLRELSITSVITVPITVDKQNIGAITMIAADLKRAYTQSDVEMAKELATRASLAIANAQLYDKTRRDLEERNRLQAELRTANENLEHRVRERTSELADTNLSLERSNQELQDFAYVASHDLQEPLRKIQAFGNLLETEQSEQLGESGQDYLRRMRGAAARMSILIDDILSFSRVTTKGREFTNVNLRTIAQEVVGDLEIRIADTQATIKVGDLPTIHADAVQMRQLLQNLIANAIKFHRPNVPPVVNITSTIKTLANKSKLCVLKVSDNGLGFDEKYLNRIFAVFQRLHNRENYEGTGIGLAVCRKIAERHGGQITAQSTPNTGSTFVITLPVRHKKGENLL